MLHMLCHPIAVFQISARPDGAGGWIEHQMDPLLLWAAIKPLPPLRDNGHQNKDLKARSPLGRGHRERYEIHIRDQPPLGTIGEIHWGQKILSPLAEPQAATAKGYLVFQAVFLKTCPQHPIPNQPTEGGQAT